MTTDFFQKSESADDHLGKHAQPGDIDMLISPRDGKLVVAVMSDDGVHVCGLCLKPYNNDERSRLRGVEYTPQGLSSRGENWGTRMMLHDKCIDQVKFYRGNLIADRERGHKIRRFKTKVAKALTFWK